MFVFCRPRLLTVITHGRLSQEMREQLKSLSARDVLAIETACSTSILSHDELPWKRCSSLTREVYTYPEVLKVHVIAICTLGMQILTTLYLSTFTAFSVLSTGIKYSVR